MKPKLDRWIIYGNCLVGYIYDSKAYPPGTRIKTDVIRFVDVSNFDAVCVDGRYRLLEPGTEAEHQTDYLRPGDVIGNMVVGDFSKTKPVEDTGKKIWLMK